MSTKVPMRLPVNPLYDKIEAGHVFRIGDGKWTVIHSDNALIGKSWVDSIYSLLCEVGLKLEVTKPNPAYKAKGKGKKVETTKVDANLPPFVYRKGMEVRVIKKGNEENGWIVPDMNKNVGKVGVAIGFQGDYENGRPGIQVEIKGGGAWWYEIDVLEEVKVESKFKTGDKVRIIRRFDGSIPKNPQWNSDMDATIGKVGTVIPNPYTLAWDRHYIKFDNGIQWSYVEESLEPAIPVANTTFYVGDQVVLTEKFVGGPGWRSDHMETQIGKTGTVMDDYTKDNPSRYVTVKFIGCPVDFAYPADKLVLASEYKPKAPEPKFKEGDRVQVVCFSTDNTQDQFVGLVATVTSVIEGVNYTLRFDLESARKSLPWVDSIFKGCNLKIWSPEKDLKIGDEVTVRPKDKELDPSWACQMDHYVGKTGKVEKFWNGTKRPLNEALKLSVDKGMWWWGIHSVTPTNATHK